MTQTRRALLALGGLAVASAVAAAALFGGPLRAYENEATQMLSDRCRTFEKVSFFVVVPIRGSAGTDKEYLFHGRSDGRWAADLSRGGGESRYSWDGEKVWFFMHARGLIHRPAYEEIARDVWNECRSGFAHSTWVDEKPWEAGLGERRRGGNWVRLDLPFGWAGPLKVYLEFSNGPDWTLREIYAYNGTERRISPHHFDWNADFPDSALDIDDADNSWRRPGKSLGAQADEMYEEDENTPPPRARGFIP